MSAGAGGGEQDGLHAELLGALDVVVVAVADMDDLGQADAHLAGGILEHGAVGLGVADDVGEHETVEMAGQIVALQQPLQAAAGRDDGVGDDAGLVAAVQGPEGFGDAGDEVGPDLDLHLLMGAHDAAEFGLRQGAAEALEDDLQPLADGPGDVLVVPDPVEGGVADVVGQADPLRVDRLLAIEGVPQEVAALGLLGAQALGLALGLVGIVVDDGIPEIEGDGFELGPQERPLFSYPAGS